MRIPAIPISRITLLRGMACAVKVQLKQRRGVREADVYVEANPAWFRSIREAIESAKSESDLCHLWHSEMKGHIKQGVWCVLGTADYSAAYTMKLRRKLEDVVGPEDANVLIANLSTVDAPLESLGPMLALEKLARDQISHTDYLEHYGHRGPEEFELSQPRPAEDSTWLEREVARIREVPLEVDDLMAGQRQAFGRAVQRLEQVAPRKAGRLGRQREESARRARLRERARSAYTRDRWAIRLWALRAGELAGLGDKIFFLRLEEIVALLSGDRSVTQAIQRRMESYRRYQALPRYPSVIRGRFDPFAWAADPQRPTDVFDAEGIGGRRTDQDLVIGSPGSAGVSEGIVRVIDHPGDGHTLEPGDVLVAVQTDIAWTLLFPRAAAVVTDVGAPLSHAAIVARELGIPAVVGCGNATAVLQTGDRVRVDGGRGVVERLGEAARLDG
jgi:pyruvate,water dikinase